MARELDQDELIDRWTLVGDELNLVAGKRGRRSSASPCSALLHSKRPVPSGKGEIPDAAVDYVARQVAVGATEIAFYEWSGRTIEFHRAQIRKALEFREGSVADAEALADRWSRSSAPPHPAPTAAPPPRHPTRRWHRSGSFPASHRANRSPTTTHRSTV